jgi:hypothetical protein
VAGILNRPVLYAHLPHFEMAYGKFRLLHDIAADPLGRLPLEGAGPWLELQEIPRRERRGMSLERRFRLTQVQTHPSSADGLRTLLAALPKGRFVLDIDLDYFMSIDSRSGFNRQHPMTQRRTEWNTEYEHRLRFGRILLDDRLTHFERLLVSLRDAGRLPAYITIADSTYRPFASTLAGVGYWEYMPYEFAGYVHWCVRHILAAVYRDHGIAAGT